MDKTIIISYLIICTTIVWAENRRGLLEAIFGSTAIGSTAMQISNVNKYENSYAEEESEKSSDLVQNEKLFSGHHDSFQFPIPTLQTVVIHKPRPEPIHIHKPPKEQIYIHEEKPHDYHYYVVKPHHQPGHHKPIELNHHNTHKPVYVAVEHKPVHETHDYEYKPQFINTKPVYIGHKPDHNNHPFSKPQAEQIYFKPVQSNDYNKPPKEQYLHKPIHESYDVQDNTNNKNPYTFDNRDRNIIIQIVSDKPESFYENKQNVVHFNPGNPIHNMGPIQFVKPSDANNQYKQPVYISTQNPNLETLFSNRPNSYPVIIHQIPSSSNPIKDNIKENESLVNNPQDSKKPINLWDLLTKPFQTTNLHQDHDTVDDEACNDDTPGKPLKCLFKGGNIKKLNSSDSSTIDPENKNDYAFVDGPKNAIQFAASSQMPTIASLFPPMWVTKPLLQRHQTEDQQNTEDDAVVDEEDEDDKDIEPTDDKEESE